MLDQRNLTRFYEISPGRKPCKIHYKINPDSRKGTNLTIELVDWMNRDSWSLNEAAYLSCGLLPPQGFTSKRSGAAQKKLPVLKNSLAEPQLIELRKIKDLIRRAKAIQKLEEPTQPKDFIEWLEKKRPSSLICALGTSNKPFTFAALEAEHSSEELTPKQRSAETNKINTVYRILISLAMEYTGYNHAQPKSSLKAIEAAMDSNGLKITHSILNDHLSKAWENNSETINDRIKIKIEKTKLKKI